MAPANDPVDANPDPHIVLGNEAVREAAYVQHPDDERDREGGLRRAGLDL
ncbi:MAG: hypothetical protein WCC28_22620 [Mycobacterium sp.]